MFIFRKNSKSSHTGMKIHFKILKIEEILLKTFYLKKISYTSVYFFCCIFFNEMSRFFEGPR